eukprot:6102935-Prymnesium_polylepis.1
MAEPPGACDVCIAAAMRDMSGREDIASGGEFLVRTCAAASQARLFLTRSAQKRSPKRDPSES